VPIASRSGSCSDPRTSHDGRVTKTCRTRSLAGARLALACALALGAAGPAQAAAADAGPLPWRVGGRVGFTVDAAAFPDSAGTTLDVYVRIPPGTLAALVRDAEGQARLRVVARLRSAYGGARAQEQTQEFAIEPGDSVAGFGKVVGLRFPVGPGSLRLLVRVEDVFSRKRTLAALVGRPAPESERVEGELRVSRAEFGRDLSDLEFVWTSQTGGAPSSFQRGGRTLLPNPERLYGLFATGLQAAFVARAGMEKPWHWTARVLDAGGRPVAARESTATATRLLQGCVVVDLSTEPAGAYDLELRVWQEGDAAPIVRRARFSVAWKEESWLRNPRDAQDEAHFLLGADDEEAFAAFSPGEQERYLDEFWAARDPVPGTGENEARSTFLRRVDHANRTYTRPGLGKGMFSDMGRVYIRYGEPSEVVNQVIPTGDQTVDLAISQITANEDRAIGDVNAKGPGGDPRPFELWIYQGPVGLPPDADPRAADHPRRRRLVFLFVDEQGVGDYRLRYTTE
jgi:GWxTD domain-containing protein